MRSLRSTLLPWALLAMLPSAFAADVSVKVTDKAGKPLADAVVSMVSTGAAAAPSTGVARVDQVDMEFKPLVSAVQAGTRVEFPNSDNTRHHVYSFSPTKTFDIKLYANRPASPVQFDKSGTVVLGCNIHDHMVAWVRVVDSPWFAVSDASGNVRITGAPAGEYRLVVWHPSLAAEPAAEVIKLAAEPVSLKKSLDAISVDEMRKQAAQNMGV